jgi:NAD(P) transhydrogenase subunit alpha
MRVGVPREPAGETRVAATPETVATMAKWGWDVDVETGAGDHAGFTDDAYRDAGASVSTDPARPQGAGLVLRVGPPTPDDVNRLHEGAVIVGFLDPFVDGVLVRALAERKVTALAVEAIPRTTLAQSMDALSSQANLAGYAAVLTAAAVSPKLVPMMVTAAGTIRPAKALILGAGVAGLQAIATARRLGAIVYGYDIRSETKEQVESLGARFVTAPTAEAGAGGYATEVGEDVQRRQFEALAPHVADADVIVTTAQIPGRPAPRLITAEMVASMHAGSVIVDMAAATGGNVEGTRPDETVEIGGVTILGPTNLASMVATDASRMYARNLVALLERARDADSGELIIDLDDEIIGGCTIVHLGAVVHPLSRSLVGMGPNE